MMKKKIWLWICLFLILGEFCAPDKFALSIKMIHASELQKERVKAGIFYFEGYHVRNEEGELTGYGIEFLNLASKYSHLNFEYVGYDASWNSMLAMLENGEIDVVTSARKNPEREAKFAFSVPIGRNSTILSIRADDTRFHNGNYKSYDGMRIGVLTGSSQNQELEEFAAKKEFSFQIQEYDDAGKLAKALQGGVIDAILTSDLRKRENEKTLDTLETENFYAMVRKEDTWLLDELNYAIEQMDINEGDWTNSLFYKYYGAIYSEGLVFTERELAYIQDVVAGRKTITVTALGNRAPYSYAEDGMLKGIMPDYFEKVMELAGLPYKTIVPKDQAEYDTLAETNGVDVVIDGKTADGIVEDDAYRGFYTDAYLSAGVARVTRADFDGDIRTVAVADVQGAAPLEKGVIGEAAVLNYETREEALQAVFDGKADAVYVYTYVAQMFVNNDFTNSLRYSIVNGIHFDFRMYVRDSTDHELVTILNKCIRQMEGDVLNSLIEKNTFRAPGEMTFAEYMRAHPEGLALLSAILLVVCGLILTLLLRARWNKKILETTEQANRELERQLAIVDALSYDYVNVYAVNISEDTARVLKLEGYVAAGVGKDSQKPFPYTKVVLGYVKGRVHPEDQERMMQALSLEYVAKKLESDTEYIGSYRVLEGEETHNFQFTFVRLFEDGMSGDGMVLAAFRNIDELVRKEQEQREALAEALAEAQHANHAKTAFLNNMSHDIRTPMNAIIGFTSLAASHLDSKEQVQNYLDKITTSGKHLLSLINDVLDMSRIESGKVKIEEKEASLPEIMHDLRTIVQSDIKARQLDFSIDTLDVMNETIICDKLRLNQVLLNILSNAMKYTKPGGAVSVRIIQTPDAPEGYASYQFKIKDTGIGMSAEFLKHLFEPFEREQTATVSGIQGTGLGLAITKNIIDMMGGTVEVESEPGKGTEFTVFLRFRIANPAKEEEALKELAGLRVLVADDDAGTCMSISKMLSSIGMRPDWMTQGKEAVMRAEFAIEQGDPYDIYMVDWMMPDMNGVEVVRRIRRLTERAAQIILFTAYDWTDMEEEAKEAGVTAFCSKPVFFSELCKILTNSSAKPEKTKENLAERFAGKKILLAEDNEINQEIAEVILEEAGFVLEIVDDGAKAVERISKMPPRAYDLVLMDIQMPIMDGYEATKAIRALPDPARAGIPIVAMTANAFEEDRQMAIHAGMNGHVAKPIDIDKLMEMLKDILCG